MLWNAGIQTEAYIVNIETVYKSWHHISLGNMNMFHSMVHTAKLLSTILVDYKSKSLMKTIDMVCVV